MIRSYIDFTAIILVFVVNIVTADVLYVPGGFPSIQNAYDNAQGGDTLLIAPGLYQESVIMENYGVTIASYFIIDNDYSIIENTVIHPEQGLRTINASDMLDTVRITGLLFELSDPYELSERDGSVIKGKNLIIDNCVIRNNSSDWGNICILPYGSLSLYSNVFESNSCTQQGGALLIYMSEANIDNNIFINNSSEYFSGAISISSSSVTITNNYFYGNTSAGGAGAIYLGGLADNHELYRVLNNIFVSNTSGAGGAINIGNYVDSLFIQDNVFRSNHAIYGPYWGGALYVGNDCDVVDIKYNEFYYNTAELDGGAAVLRSNAIFRYNLLYRNQAPEKYALTATSPDEISPQVYGNLFFQNSYLPNGHTPDYGCLAIDDPSVTMEAWNNDFVGNAPLAAGQNGGTLNLEENYWGHLSGPYHPSQNPGGMGDSVMNVTNILPFSDVPFTTRWLHEPEQFELILPEANAFLSDSSVTFLWYAALDSTPHDTLRYILEIADNPDFIDASRFNSDMDTAITIDNLGWEVSYSWRVWARDIFDLETLSSETRSLLVTKVAEEENFTIPAQWSITHVYPNPFNRAVQVFISAPASALFDGNIIRLSVIDIQGRVSATIYDGPLSPGNHRFVWQPSTSAGVYFLHATADDWQETRKLVFLK